MFEQDIDTLLVQLSNLLLDEAEKNTTIPVCNELNLVEHKTLALPECLSENKSQPTNIDEDADYQQTQSRESGRLQEIYQTLLQISGQMKEIAQGNYNQKIETGGSIALALNNIVQSLKQYDNKNKELSEMVSFLLEQTSSTVFEYDIVNKTIEYSDELKKLFNFDNSCEVFPDSVIAGDYIYHEDRAKFLTLFSKIDKGSLAEREEIRIKYVDEYYIWCLVAINVFARDENKSLKAIVQISDISYVDKLTGTHNRLKFELDATKVLKKGEQEYALILFNIDKFKVLNDSFGYQSGDLLLKLIASAINKILSKDEMCSRYVADQFYILMKYVDNTTIVNRLRILYYLVEEEFKARISKYYNLVLCSGVCIVNNNFDDFKIESNKARYALRDIKGSRKSSIAFYDEKVGKQIIQEKEIESKMHIALKNKDFQLFLQPKYSLLSEEIVGAEALVRWMDEEKGLIYPNSFIPIFERNGFIIDLDMYMLEQSCLAIRNWIDKGIKPVTISVNFSRLHLVNEHFVMDIKDIVEKYHVPHKLIEIELTESTMLDNTEILICVLRQLHEIGFTLSIDDFGSGYSSLGMLKDLPVDIIKLDRSFFAGDIDYERGREIIGSVIALAKKLHIITVAEGVETREHVDLLSDLGCDIAQGYYFARPMLQSEMEWQLKNY